MNSDANKTDVIELPPRVPPVQSDNVCHWMEWHAAMPRQITDSEIRRLEGFLSQGGISVCFRNPNGNHIEVKVQQTPIGDYTELYDASLRALFYLEREVGNLVEIEGYPRSKWDIQFVFAKRFGALE